MYKINNINAPINFDEENLNGSIAKYLGKPEEFIMNGRLLKKSLDARKKDDLHYVIAVAFESKLDLNLEEGVELFDLPISRIENLPIQRINSDKPFMVVGSGPSGLFCALTLLTFGQKVILVERGEKIEDRNISVERLKTLNILNAESNVQYGEGGAGTYSDGKLNTGIKSPYLNLILSEFVDFGAPNEILYLSKPHIGTDYLQNVVKNIRAKIYALGGQILFNTRFVDIKIENGKLTKAVLDDGNNFEADICGLALATGHSSYDTYKMLNDKGVNIAQKPFSMGVRIEHLQEDINFAQYGTKSRDLPPADYKLATHLKNNRSAYTFCMCPGGEVVCSSTENGVVTNGMSNYKRDGKNGNSALLVNVMPEDFGGVNPLDGYAFQSKYEQKIFRITKSYNAPTVKVGDFLKQRLSKEFGKVRPTYLPGTAFMNLKDCLPPFVEESLRLGIVELDKKMRGFADKDAVLTGIETRSSSPIRVLRDDNFMSNIEGLYPVGEGAGYAGGIMSSANDGLLMAIDYLNRK